MYKIIFFDLDGTLLTDESEILEENKLAIKEARENNIDVVICSGRQKKFAEKCRESAGAGKYLISTNGAAIYNLENNEEIFACGIDKNLTFDLYNLTIKNNYLIRIDTKYARYLNNMKYALKDDIKLDENIDKFLNDNDILQISIGTNEEKEIDEIIDSLKDKPFVKVENKYCVTTKDFSIWIINIINSSVSKGNAISGLCKYLKIDLKDAIAFGDDLNDISMMKTVGLGVAMENAMPQVKEFAKVVIGDNNKPSIAEFVNKVIEENKL